MQRQVHTVLHVRRFGRRKIPERLDWRIVATFFALAGITAFLGLLYNERVDAPDTRQIDADDGRGDPSHER